MKDRVPLYPGRVRLTPVSGQENTYDMVRADEPTQEGTPLNKASLLKDSTATLLGLPDTAVPDDALIAILIGVNKYAFRLTFTFLDGSPVAGKTVDGLTSLDGTPVVTDENGNAFGVSSTPTVEIGMDFTEYIDLENFRTTLTATAKITDVTIKISSISATSKTITTSGQYRFSPNVKDYDVAAIGGGGSGGYNKPFGGGGGGGGSVANMFGISVFDLLTVIVGAQGKGMKPASSSIDRDGNDGGSSSVVNLNLTAPGGGGGRGALNNSGGYANSGGSSTNGGRGGDGSIKANFAGSSGGSRTVAPFGDETIKSGGGGGGGGHTAYNVSGGPGGASFGGNGGEPGENGNHGKGYGGGGGGSSSEHNGGDGYQGAVMFRWRLIAA